ncbi:MAG: Dabb family protein [Bacteroidota bacterium]
MIRHIVMFKLKDFGNETEKENAAFTVIKRLNELPLKINVIRNYEAGIDIRRLAWSFDILLTMDFNTVADLDFYTIHPAHQEFIAFNKDYSIDKVCIDYLI